MTQKVMVVQNKNILLEQMSNNQILVEMREMKMYHDNTKKEMMSLLSKLEELEEKYDNHNKELHKRLKG